MATVSNQVSRAMRSDGTFVAELLGWDGQQLQGDGPLTGSGAGVVDAGPGFVAFECQGRLAVALHALRVGAVQRQTGEELGGHAPAPAAVIVSAAAARARRLRLTQLAEQRCVLPDILETIVRQNVSGKKLVMDGERAGVDVANRVDQAYHPAGAAQVQPGQRTGLAEARQVEERVSG